MPEVDDLKTVRDIQAITRDHVARGIPFHQFVQVVKDQVDLRRHQQETIYRTNVHQSYIDGQQQTLEKPVVSRAFPFVLYVTSKDGRVRLEHQQLEGLVVSRDGAEYKLMRAALADWNCRCSLIPMSRKKAEKRGVSTMSDIPFNVRQKYGFAAA